mgnify:CR=1 FL=1
MVTLFSQEYGKITAIAYGARRPKSRVAGTLQPFAVVDVELARAKGLPKIKQCVIIQSFRKLRADLAYMAYASLIAELVAILCPEQQPEPEVYDLVLAAFNLLQQRNPRVVTLACIWQLLALTGFYPQYKHCLQCGQEISFPAYFDAAEGGAVCLSCGATSKLPLLSQQAGEFLDRLINLNWRQPPSFTVTGAALIEVEKILAQYLLMRLERPLKSLTFLNLLHHASPDKSAPMWEQ